MTADVDRAAAPVAAEGANDLERAYREWASSPLGYGRSKDGNDPHIPFEHGWRSAFGHMAARPAPPAAPREPLGRSARSAPGFARPRGEGEKHWTAYPWYDDRGRLGSLEEWSNDLATLLQDEIAEDDVPQETLITDAVKRLLARASTKAAAPREDMPITRPSPEEAEAAIRNAEARLGAGPRATGVAPCGHACCHAAVRAVARGDAPEGTHHRPVVDADGHELVGDGTP